MDFMHKHGKTISNAAVVVLVLLAVYVKLVGEDTGKSALFGQGDSPIIIAALAVFVLLAWVVGRAQKRR